MLTRREFFHAAGAASVAVATTECSANGANLPAFMEPIRCPSSEPTYFGQPAAYWLMQLEKWRNGEREDKDYSPHLTTRDALVAFGASVIPGLRQILLSDCEEHFREEIVVLSLLGEPGKAVLLEAIHDLRAGVRKRAIYQLALEFRDAPEVPAVLLTALDDENAEVRGEAVFALHFAREDTKPVLEKALASADPLVRRHAVEKVLQIDPTPEYANPLLMRLLHDPDSEVRWAAVHSLFFFHMPVYAGVVPVLLELFHEGRPEALNYVPFAGRCGFEETLKLLQGDDVAKRAAAAGALAYFIGGNDPETNQTARKLPAVETAELLLACRRAAQDNDLAVRLSAERVVAALEGN